MLLLNLSNIRTAQERFERVFSPDQFAPEEEFRVVVPVSLAFDIFKDKQQFRLVGRVQTTLELPCGRCLEPYTTPVEQLFDLRYHPRALNTGEGERELQDDDLTTAFYDNDEIDLGHLMNEQFYLGLPMKPLCRSDCKGLCPVCGTDLNNETCACKRDWEDPRLAALKKFRVDS